MPKLRNNTYWSDFYTAQGVRVRKSLGTTDLKTAKTLEAQLIAQYTLNLIENSHLTKADIAQSAKRKSLTLDTVFRKAMNQRQAWKESNSRVTLEKNFRLLTETPAYKMPKALSLYSIDNEAIRNALDVMRDLEQLSGSTINQRLSLLSVLFDFAVDDMGIDDLHKPRIKRQKPSQGRTKRYSHDEELRAIKWCLEHSDVQPKLSIMADLIPFLADTGFRLSEALNLEYSRVNFELNSLTVLITKNKKPKAIPMTDRVRSILLSRKAQGVSTMPFGELDSNQADKLWAKIRKAIGLADDKEAVLHSFRHTTASRLADADVNPFAIMKMLGHSNIQTTQGYVHMSANGLGNAVESLNKSAEDVPKGVTKLVSKVPEISFSTAQGVPEDSISDNTLAHPVTNSKGCEPKTSKEVDSQE